MKKFIVLLFVSAVIVSGCITIESGTVSEEDKIPVEDLKLEKGVDIYQFRVDLVRSVKEENTSGKETDKNTDNNNLENLVPYHYLGVRFGNGLFYDYNRNLCVDLVEFYNINEEKFTITQKSRELLGPSTIYSKIADSFKREVKGILGNKTTAEFSDGEIKIEEGLFKTDVQILISASEIQCNPKGIFGFLGKAKVRDGSEDTVEFPGFWKDSVFTQNSANQISLNKEFAVINAGNEIIIEYKGIFEKSGVYRFIKIPGGFVFNDGMKNTVKVVKSGNKISIQPFEGFGYSAVIE